MRRAVQHEPSDGRPLARFLYRLLHAGDVSPGRLERLVEDLEMGRASDVDRRPPLDDIVQYASAVADRIEALAHVQAPTVSRG